MEPIRYGDRIACFFIHKAELVFRIRVQKVGVILIVSLGVVEIAELIPGSLLYGARGLL